MGRLFTSQPLPAGNYQVAFLEKTSQISAIPTLGYLTTLGLVQGENYVLRSFSVENGKITTLGTVTVPELEMSYPGGGEHFCLGEQSQGAGGAVCHRAGGL